MVRAMRDGTFADGSGGRTEDHDAYVRLCAFPDQGSGTNRAAYLDDDTLDADFERGRRCESGDDLSQGQAWRLVLLRSERKLRARSRAGSAGGREARDTQAAFDPDDSKGKRRSRSRRRTSRQRFDWSRLSRTV